MYIFMMIFMKKMRCVTALMVNSAYNCTTYQASQAQVSFASP